MKGKVAYVSGPMSGLPNHNYDAFAEAAHWLRQHRFENVVSPHEVDAGSCEGCMWLVRMNRLLSCAGNPDGQTMPPYVAVPPHDWQHHMRADIVALMECDTIVMLPGWPRSRGARLELTIAMELGFRVWLYDALASPRLTEMSR